MQQKLAELVDQFNRLNEEQRFEEAEVIAKRAEELAPHELVTQVMVQKSRIQRRPGPRNGHQGTQGRGLLPTRMNDVDEASDPVNGEPYQLPRRQELEGHDQTASQAGTGLRTAITAARRRSRSKRSSRRPSTTRCHNRPLSEVLNQLAKLANVNIHLDEEGLREEGLSPDTPVTLELTSDIKLKSYLNLILEKHHLCYVVKDEVLNITSERRIRDEPGLPAGLPGGRPGDADSELRRQPADGPGRRAARRHGQRRGHQRRRSAR